MSFSVDEALRRLQNAFDADRLAHAYLVTGEPSVPFAHFISCLAGKILATRPEEIKKHPDFHEIRPESKSRKILVETIRTLEHAIYQKAISGKNKVVVIHDADRLMEQAANAFLKTLEEPPPNTHILLTSSLPNAVLSTILSRCIEIPLRVSARKEWTQREEASRDIARKLLNEAEPCGITEIFLAVRDFQALLLAVKNEAEKSAEAALKELKSHYKDKTDLRAEWVEEQEKKFAAQAQSKVISERSRLLDALVSVLTERLLQASCSGDPRINNKISLRLLRQIEGISELRTCLERQVSESLAIESVFLEIFSRT